MATVYKIHPAIGCARVGNSPDYYLAPETPGGLPLDPQTGKPIYAGPDVPGQNIFHDAQGRLKKQGARFKVFAYDDADPNDPGQRVVVGQTKVNGKAVSAIEWTVYLANKKASWFQFEQLTGSGLEGDAGYLANNTNNPGGQNPDLPYNPIRYNNSYNLTSDPAALGDPARKQLILDPGPRTVSGRNVAPQEFNLASKNLQPFNVVTLGKLLTDSDGNLIVLGGEGSSGTTDAPVQIEHYANNHGWFDDVSDGPVSGVLVLEDGSRVPIGAPAWVLCGPPKYAPELINIVSMYDTMYDIFVRDFGLNPNLYQNGQFQADYKPSYPSDIAPILIRPNRYQYVAAISSYGRTNHEALPSYTSQQFASNAEGYLRSPAQKDTAGLMPKLAGDNPLSQFQKSDYLTLTATQYFILSQFAKGLVTQTADPIGEGVALDRANLENCVGGAFCPGIEMTWIARNTTIYHPLPAKPALSDAFRIRHKDVSGGLTLTNGADNDYSNGVEPGDIIKYMAQPWQADFNECSVQPIPAGGPEYWWWPAQRPIPSIPLLRPRLNCRGPGSSLTIRTQTTFSPTCRWSPTGKTSASSSMSAAPASRATSKSNGTSGRSRTIPRRWSPSRREGDIPLHAPATGTDGQSRAAFDVVIVGGGPAGCATALTLSRLGIERVMVVEATQYRPPRIGETIPPDTGLVLRQLEVWRAFLNEEHLPCFGSCASWGSDAVGYNDFVVTGKGHGWHLDHTQFDAFLGRRPPHAWPNLRPAALCRTAACLRMALSDCGSAAMAQAADTSTPSSSSMRPANARASRAAWGHASRQRSAAVRDGIFRCGRQRCVAASHRAGSCGVRLVVRRRATERHPRGGRGESLRSSNACDCIRPAVGCRRWREHGTSPR